MAADDLGWNGTAIAVQFRMAENVNYSAGEVQFVNIPARPNVPTAPLKLTKTADSITKTCMRSS